MKKILIIILGLTFIITSLNLGHSAGIGSTGANFLKIGISSRATAMGEAYTALADDAYAICWNPGGLGNIKYNEIAFTCNEYLEGISEGFVTFVYPTRYAGVYGGSVIYLTSGNIKEIEINSTGGYKDTDKFFNAHEYCFIGSYGYKFNRNISAGGNLKLIQGKLADYSSDLTFGLDLGIIYFPWKVLSLGLSVQNMGTEVRYDKKDFKLPFTVRLGTALRLLDDNLILALDINKPNDNKVNVHVGMEGTLAEVLSLRAGYQVGNKDDLWSYSMGFGARIKGLYFDYAFKPAENFSNTHKISLGWKFGGVMGEDEVIDYDGMRKKEEYIRKKEEKNKLKPKKMKKKRDEEDYDEIYDYEIEDNFYDYLEKELP